EEIWEATLAACAEALKVSDTAPDAVTCIGITNQRETTLLYERDTLRPIHRAIVWQDRRTADRCEQLRAAGHEPLVRQRTGLVLDAYFSGTKAAWLLDTVPGARERAERGELAFATIDTWLVARLTAGAAHVTEPSNASRTMLYDLGTGAFCPELCALLDVPLEVLPEIRDSSGHFGDSAPEAFLGVAAPITGIAGDQQAALFGQGAWTAGTSKNTYGTGSFLLFNTGHELARSGAGLLTSVGWRLDGRDTYVLEGAIFVTGASVQWMRDQLGIIDHASESEALAAELPPGNEGVYLVPAFTGLGAPHWDPHARGLLIGLTRGTDRRHLARAALEAMAYQTADVVAAMTADARIELAELRVDGGAAANDLLCRFQADMLGVPVVRPRITETTVLGAAFLAGLGAGVWSSLDELAGVWQLDRRFEPRMHDTEREHLLVGWRAAVERSGGWARITEH
ncbi:MAG: glycerol kinase, partial [Actinomycetota bacterium]|nr:glycerol kinase [Actinomycetota bacterium]